MALDESTGVGNLIERQNIGKGFQMSVESVGVTRAYGISQIGHGTADQNTAVFHPCGNATGKVSILQSYRHGGKENFITGKILFGADNVWTDARLHQRLVEILVKLGLILQIREHGLKFKDVPCKGGEEQSRIGLYLGAIDKIGAFCHFIGGAADLVKDVKGSARCREKSAVHHLVSRVMGSPEPVKGGFTAKDDGSPGADAAKAVGLEGLRDLARALPAGRGLGDPEGTILQSTHIVEPKALLAEIFHVGIVIVLDHVAVLCEHLVIQAVQGLGVGADGSLGVFLQNADLLLDKACLGLALEQTNLQLGMRALPAAVGEGDLLKGGVVLAKEIEVPGVVECLDGFVFVLQMLPIAILTVGTMTILGQDLVVDLPADDVFIGSELLRHLLHDAQTVLYVFWMVGTAVSASAVLDVDVGVVHDGHVGILFHQPYGRGCRGGTKQNRDAGIAKTVNDVM